VTAPELDLMAVVRDIRDHVTGLWGPAPTTLAEPQGEDPGATITYENGPTENWGTADEPHTAHWVHIYMRDHAAMWPQVTLQPRQAHVLAVYPWPAD
jgi:hypothetical protein